MIWSEVKEIWADGPREYIMHLWNLLDFGMLSIFVASFTARFIAFLKASKAQLYVDLHVTADDLSNASLPDEIAYFTYGEWSPVTWVTVLGDSCWKFYSTPCSTTYASYPHSFSYFLILWELPFPNQ